MKCQSEKTSNRRMRGRQPALGRHRAVPLIPVFGQDRARERVSPIARTTLPARCLCSASPSQLNLRELHRFRQELLGNATNEASKPTLGPIEEECSESTATHFH